MNNIKRVILIGPQGSGKSTQSKVVADFLGISFISAGDILRKAIAKNTGLGKKIAILVQKGSLVSNDLMNRLMLEELKRPKYSKGFLLDGYPRNLGQARVLDKEFKIDKLFNIEITNKEAIKRITGRRICSNGHVFHIKHKPSKKKDKCDVCNKELYQRKDDNEKAVSKRLGIYRKKTEKLLDYYNDRLVVFNGQNSIDIVTRDILKYLKKNAR